MRMMILIICLLESASSGFDLMDTAQSIREQAWESEYIPESTTAVISLSDYDDFEVVELFRAETIEELEASLEDGYPYAWLEETLKDTSVPWEDRYWLDRRVRAAISQNLHVFYDTENNPVHIDADAVFPGEYYWREHMIVDPAGWNVPEGTPRPVALEKWDVGHLYDSYGYRVGEIAVPVPRVVSLSRDASIGVITSGGNGVFDFTAQPYACFMYPDGSFLEVPLDSIGMYDCIVSPDGSVVAFFCAERLFLPFEERERRIVPIFVFDKNGILSSTIVPPVPLRWGGSPAISQNGRYACHYAQGANACLIDFPNRNAELLTKPTDVFNRNTTRFEFSPDGEFLCLGGSTTGRIMSLSSKKTYIFPETEPVAGDKNTKTVVCCSNDRFCTTVSIRREQEFSNIYELYVYANHIEIYSTHISEDRVSFPLQLDVSPNGNYILMNPENAAHGAPSAFAGIPGTYNLPLVTMQIEDR